MGNKVAKIVKGEAKKFNKLRAALKPVGVTLTLQLKNGEALTFTNELVVALDWYYEEQSYKERVKVMVAKVDDATFEAALEKASDVLIGSNRYEIDKRDITPPDGETPHWKFYGIMNAEVY